MQNQKQRGTEIIWLPLLVAVCSSSGCAGLGGTVKDANMELLRQRPEMAQQQRAEEYARARAEQERLHQRPEQAQQARTQERAAAHAVAEQQTIAALRRAGLKATYLDEVYQEMYDLDAASPGWDQHMTRTEGIQFLVDRVVARIRALDDQEQKLDACLKRYPTEAPDTDWLPCFDPLWKKPAWQHAAFDWTGQEYMERASRARAERKTAAEKACVLRHEQSDPPDSNEWLQCYPPYPQERQGIVHDTR